MFHEGRQIGSYTLLRKLGKGGFGEVWLAEKRSQFVTKKVAVKLPLDEQINFDAIRQEATLWEQASGHANVLPIIDADIVDGQVVIVSEYADGGSLHDKLKREGKLSVKQAIEMTIGILNGLEFLHNRKIIHRDIKPQNILLQGDTPRLADFGISRAMQTNTISSRIIGTDSYMSPEAFDGKRSIQTDIWSVGVVLYQLLTGNLPFPQENPSEKMFAILQKDFEILPNDVPQNLKRIITKALAKLSENRYKATGEMRDDLRQFLKENDTQTLKELRNSSVQQNSDIQTELPTIETVVKPIEKIGLKSKPKYKNAKDVKSLSKTNSFGNEIIAICVLSLAVLLFLCLISYSQNDPSIITTSSQKTQNWIGVIGANIAAFLISSIGWTAYFLPALLVLIAWRCFRAKSRTFTFDSFIGYVLFVVSCASLLTVFGLYGGFIGAFFEQIFLGFLGKLGTGVLFSALLATASLLVTNFSLGSFFGDFGWAWENFRIRFNEWRGKRRELIESNNKQLVEVAEKRNELRQNLSTEKKERLKKLPREEKHETVTKKVSDIFNLSKNFKDKESGDLLEIADEPLSFDRETEDLPPTILNSDELVLEIEKPMDLVAGSEKFPITPIRETGDLDWGFLEIEDEEEVIPPPKKPQTFENYVLPTPEFLTPAAPRIEQKDEELLDIAQEIADKTREFNVTGRVMHICQGPVVTTYEFKPDPGVKYSQLVKLSDDLSFALKVDFIHINRISGKAGFGIEIPNRERETIQLREVIESKKFQTSDSLLSIALGKAIDGLNYVADLAKLPHLLIAGTTMSGKSTCLHSIIVSVLYKAKPDEVKFIMVDPKQVELGIYADIPHLATPIIKDPKRASVALKWAVGQMERRYKDLAAWGVRNIDGYNAEVKARNETERFDDNGEPHKKLPYLVIIIDELADLMMVAGKEVESCIEQLSQKGRAVGIHLVITTQNISNKAIFNLTKTNFPSKISFRSSSKTDSQNVINSDAAENLLGKGDMFFSPPGTSNPIRVHGAFVDEKEIARIIEHIKLQGNPEYDTTITKTDEELDDSGDLPGKRDPLFWDAVKSVVSAKRASTSLLQRHLRIGYGRAAAILDAMVREGYIGEMDGSTRARPILQAAYDALECIESDEF